MSVAPGVTQAALLSCTEHDLIAAVRRGEDRAFESLYTRYGRRINSYVYGMVGDHQRAEDITQEVFISALRRIRESVRPINFKPWIYEIAKNACIDEFRRARRAQEVPIEGDDELAGLNPRLMARTPTPEAEVESRQQLANLRGAFRGLSESHHKIIVLRELEGRSYAEIGERLGMSRPVVESTLFRARRRLGEEYEDLVSGHRCEQVREVIGRDTQRQLRLGIKERRLVARHLSHCQGCRRAAYSAGVDESLLKPGVIGKIAALFPIPAWLRLRRRADVASPSHSARLLQSAQTVATSVSSPSFSGFGRAAAATATLVIAGAGGGLVTGFGSSAAPHRNMTGPPATAAGVVAGAHVSSARGGGGGAATGPGGVAATGAGGRAPGTGRAVIGASASATANQTGAGGQTASGTNGISGSGLSSSAAAAPLSSGAGAGTMAGGSGTSGGGHDPLPGVPKVPVPGSRGLPSLPTVAIPQVQLPAVSVSGLAHGLRAAGIGSLPHPAGSGTGTGAGTGGTSSSGSGSAGHTGPLKQVLQGSAAAAATVADPLVRTVHPG